MNTLYLAIPCYNEEKVLAETSKRLYDKIESLISTGVISGNSKIIFINDGSRDATWAVISRICSESERFGGISLSRNCGHQNALAAGLTILKNHADMIISIDADLQDDIDAIDKMIFEYQKGSEIVFGVRSCRKSDSFLKKFTAEGYYKLLRVLGCDIVFNHADYRLMSARALNALSEYGERDPFLRGIVPMLGFKTASVEYERKSRLAGESKYSIKKMLSLASDGAFSLSLRPVRFILLSGVVFLSIGVILFIYILASGFNALMFTASSVWFCTGVLLAALSVTGEYSARAFLETKARPRYHIEATTGIDLEGII